MDEVGTKFSSYDRWDLGYFLQYTLAFEWFLLFSAFAYFIFYMKKVLSDDAAAEQETADGGQGTEEINEE